MELAWFGSKIFSYSAVLDVQKGYTSNFIGESEWRYAEIPWARLDIVPLNHIMCEILVSIGSVKSSAVYLQSQ